MKQVNYLDKDYKKNLRNKVWELLKNGDIEEADKIFSSKLDIHEIMGTWNWLHKYLSNQKIQIQFQLNIL